jgi:hypothetical protein
LDYVALRQTLEFATARLPVVIYLATFVIVKNSAAEIIARILALFVIPFTFW